ncbi:MAG TPA: cation transporter [Bacteroidetes bacterium]|nr:cation transporter [Bacteroidota bacterium]
MKGHHFHRQPDRKEGRPSSRNLLISTGLNGGITVVQVVGGIVSGSLALISDALHNFSDTLAILLAYLAIRMGKKPSNLKKTFGYKRVEILTALFNGVVLIGISLYLFFEAWERFHNPRPVRGGLMLWVAVTGLLANLVAVLLLRKDSRSSLNVKAAYLHLLGDTLSSVGVIGGALLIVFFNITWVDPLLTVLIGIFILRETWSVIRDTVNILMEASPQDLDLGEIRTRLEEHPLVDNVHHVHAWQLSDQQVHFECHADLKEDLPLSRADKVRQELEELLTHHYRIHHVTIQVEFGVCGEKDMIYGN